MNEFLVRLNGKPKEYLSRLLNEGYFSTKAEVVRLGIIEVSKRYLDNGISKDELELVGKAVERDLKKVKNKKFNTERDFKKKYDNLIR